MSYDYNPKDPVATLGGAGMLAFLLPGYEGAEPANVFQGEPCQRRDVISYLTDTLEEGLMISGEIGLSLRVSSSAPDTSFTMKLIEVFPDGRAINIRDAITSLGYRNDSKERQSYSPGSRITLGIDSWPIEWWVSKGSRLRLDVSSSDFPKYHAHTNRAGPWAKQVGTDIAAQTIYGGILEIPVNQTEKVMTP